jgi:hypothetical protein
MGRGHTGNDLLPESYGTEDDALAFNRDGQIVNRNLFLYGSARPAQIDDLVFAEHGASDYIAYTSLRQMHNFGKDSVGPERLLLP